MQVHCPICGRPTDSATSAEFPFCSGRCRLLDLANWATERYVVSEPAFEEDDPQGAPSSAADPEASED